MMTLGIPATSLKENERRVAIHPDHLIEIDEAVRRRLIFECGYGRRFGVGDAELAAMTGGVAQREELFDRCQVIALPKPVHTDLERMRPGQVLWGWCHAVQDRRLAQIAIDRRLTLITWEGMNTWGPGGQWRSHVFAGNNEIAGYAAVLHATGLAGVDGHYGPPRTVYVTHWGSVSRGAVRALRALGYERITVLVRQPMGEVAGRAEGVEYRQIVSDPHGRMMVAGANGERHPLIDELARADLIVNGILQDPERPVMFVQPGEQERLKAQCLIIDVSCDAGMGFPFATPTTFEQPMLQIGQVRYYAVDHTPSYLWNSATWQISAALRPYLATVMAGPAAWERDETIRRAIEVRDGVVVNEQILRFQRRARQWPHARQDPEDIR